MSYTPKHLGHLVMRVRDMDRSLDFYTRVMGLTIMERSPSGTVFMSANTEKSHELAIRAIGMDAAGPDSSLIGQAHMAWQMESFEDLQELYARLIVAHCERLLQCSWELAAKETLILRPLPLRLRQLVIDLDLVVVGVRQVDARYCTSGCSVATPGGMICETTSPPGFALGFSTNFPALSS